MFTRLFFFFHTRDEISSRQNRVNSKRYFIIDRDDFTCKHSLIHVSLSTDKIIMLLLRNLFSDLKVFSEILVSIVNNKVEDLKHSWKYFLKLWWCHFFKFNMPHLMCLIIFMEKRQYGFHIRSYPIKRFPSNEILI